MPANGSQFDSPIHTDPLLILLGGATCGGKSTLADQLQKTWLHSKRLSQDDFFREEDDPAHLLVTLSDGRRHQNWEHVQSVDWNQMRQQVRQLIDQLNAESHSSSERPILILEGHLILSQNWDEFSSNQIKFFFTIDRDSCYKRRQQRTYIPQDPPTYFDDIVWPMYVIHEREVRLNFPEVHILNGTDDPNSLVSFVENKLRLSN